MSLGIGPPAGAAADTDEQVLVDTLPVLRDAVDVNDDVDAGTSWGDSVDDCDGYAPPTSTYPGHLVPGDLIQVDGVDGWVVVDETPEDDLAAPGLLAISWRGDGDESGCLSVADDSPIVVRRPQEWA